MFISYWISFNLANLRSKSGENMVAQVSLQASNPQIVASELQLALLTEEMFSHVASVWGISFCFVLMSVLGLFALQSWIM